MEEHRHVYVGGYIGDTAVFWQDGVRTTLTANVGAVSGLSVSGSTIYAVGSFNRQAVYWMNETLSVLSTGLSGPME